MFDFLFLLSIILIVSSQFLPAQQAEQQPTNNNKKKKHPTATSPKTTKPHRKNTGRAQIEKLKAINY